MLSVENVTAGYGAQPVLHEVSLHVEAGRFVGLLGPNGSGKSTLFRVISGVLAADGGRVMVFGRDLRHFARRALARRMACLSQDLGVDMAFTVREVAMMGRWPHLRRFASEGRHDLEVVQRALDLADVAHLADRNITEISGGERQRAFVAMCLAQEPELLLLDEPTSHLDVGHQLLLLDLIHRLNRNNGVTVVAVFHELNLAAEYCDRLAVLDAGRVQAVGAPEEVLTEELILKVYGARVRTDNPVSGRPHIVLSAGANPGEKAR